MTQNNETNTENNTQNIQKERKEKKQHKNKKTNRILNLSILLITSIGLAYVFMTYLNIGKSDYTNSAQVESFINPINTRVSGYIKEIRFVEHQPVKKGDTLVIIDNSEILTQLGQAEAAYAAALAGKGVVENTIKTASNNVNTASSTAQSAKANIEATRARVWNAEQNYKRYQNLLRDEAITQQQFDQVKTEYEAAKAGLQAQLAQLETASNNKITSQLTVNEVQARLMTNDADIKRAENALKMAKINLSYTVITAPHDGIMGRRTVNVGQLLNPSQSIGSIVDTQNTWITANFREKQMPDVKIGKLVKIKVDALDSQEFEGKIVAISGATGAKYAAVPVDNSTGNFVKVQQRIPVRIELTPNNKKEDIANLRAGMNVEVILK